MGEHTRQCAMGANERDGERVQEQMRSCTWCANANRDADFEYVRTPTAGVQHHGRSRGHTLPDHRAFAVWGQDESDSNA